MRLLIAAVTIGISAILLFARLGRYALWDDEANTALIGQGVWRTGDTSAVVGDNIVAFRGGAELSNAHARYLPPLQYYVAAPFVGPFEPNALLARLPFTLVGLSAIILVVFWTFRATDDLIVASLMGLGIITNISLILYCRQCRYYPLALAATVSVGYLYYNWSGSRRGIVLLAAAMMALFASNYLNFVAAVVCIAVDYAIWGRHQIHVNWRQIISLAIPVIIVCGVIGGIWNPLGKPVVQVAREMWIVEHAILLWWNIRDANNGEFCAGAIMLVAVVLPFFLPRVRILWRLLAAALTYILVISITSPQAVKGTTVADLRYLMPIIPLLIAISVITIAAIAGGRPWLAGVLGLLLLGTDLPNGGNYVRWLPQRLLNQNIENIKTYEPAQFLGLRSTLSRYIGELVNPPAEPYTAAANWINANVPPGRSIIVAPDHMTYPLMYHAPKAVYAWQLREPAPAGLENLPPIHFVGQQMPDYLIAFGGVGIQRLQTLPVTTPYRIIDWKDVHFMDLYRPELLWRRFTPVKYPADWDEEQRRLNGIMFFSRQSSGGLSR